MSQREKLLLQILRGMADANVSFQGIRELLVRFGFKERIRGDHHIFTKSGVVEIINLQPKGAQAKPYQVKQVRQLILKYKMGGTDES